MTPKSSRTGLEIAVIGMAGTFPGAADLADFWRNLVGGDSSISPLGEDELLAAGVHRDLLAMDNFVRAKGVFPGIEHFDAEFFEYTPRDAALMDPQVRALHQCVFHALEDAGCASEAHKGSIGLFAGASGNFVWELSSLLDTKESAAAQFATIQLNDKDFVATRIAYKLNLRGPCVTVHCACSTSLYAIDMACRQLLTGACSVAVAAASGLNLPHRNGYVYETGMILSPDGVCRPFSDDSNGTVEGNGMGAVVLKPLDDALRERDRIYAVIRGTGANNDGARKVGYSAPSVEGQAEVIRRALHMAEVEPTSISYVEAHGTGTALGDPVEIEGLRQAMRTERTGFCGIGSLKSNIGHLDTAAGISSFIKTALALHHRRLPPSLNFRAPNREIDFDNSPFYVVREATDWHNPAVEGQAGEVHPLRAGVSSFGIGGTNVHVVLEEAPPAPASSAGRPWKLLCLTAASQEALERLEAAFAEHLRQHPEQNLDDLAHTLQTGRRGLARRRALSFAGREDLLAQLCMDDGARRYQRRAGTPRPVFLLSGQGTQYPGMARGLYAAEPVFRDALERCLALCDSWGEPRVRAMLCEALPPPAGADADPAWSGTDLAQPALFAVEYAMARLLMDWGVQPAAMIGHSLGEYVAACLAGVMRLEDALLVVLERGRLMQTMPAGAMLAVALAPEELQAQLACGLDIAAVNGPHQCTVSGPAALVDALAAQLLASGAQCKRLQTSHAFHSAMMAPVLPALRTVFGRIRLSAPRIPYVSNLTGSWISDEQAQDPEYYLAHLRTGVQFAAGARTVLADTDALFVELGPGNVLGAFLKQSAGPQDGVPVVATLRHARSAQDDAQHLTRALGDLWGHGVAIDWKAYYRGQERNRVAAPLYPFAHREFPLGRGDIYRLLESVGGTAAHGAATAAADDGVMVPSWQPALLPALDDSTGVRSCLAIVENPKLLKPLALVSGLRLLQCRPATAFAAAGGGRYSADLRRTTQYRRLVQALKAEDGMPALLVWLGHKAELEHPQALLDRVLRMAMVLRSESPERSVRCVLALPAKRKKAAGVLDELDACVRGLRAVQPQFELRVVLFNGKLPLAERAELLEREIYDPDREAVLVAYEDGRRLLYRLVDMPVPVTSSGRLAGRGVALLAPPGADLQALVARIAEASGARVQSIEVRAPQLAPQPCSLALTPHELEAWLRTEQAQDWGRHGLRDFGAEHALLDEACCVLVAHYVHGCLPLQCGRVFDREALRGATRVTPRLEKYLDYMLALLVQDGVLAREGGGYRVLRGVDTLRDIATIRAELGAASALFTGNLEILEHCVASFSQALPEQVPPISVLYPDGTSQMLMRAYAGSIQALQEEVIRGSFEQLFRQLLRRAGDRPIRILEAGGGFGLTMRRLAPLLRGVNVEYYFTDVGRTFLHEAREFALREGHDFLHFGLFDISRDPAEQGLAPKSFDLVLAFNVVHATRSLAQSVGHLRGLLRDGGLMCLLERTHVRRYIDLIWGLADGWWHFDDSERALSPLIDLPHWQRVAREAGFAEALAFPEDGPARRYLECGILVAQAPLAVKAQAAAPASERWQIAAPAEPVDVAIVIDAAHDRGAEKFEPLGERLVAVRNEVKRFGRAAQDWLERHRPQQVAVWTSGLALANAPEQIAHARAAQKMDRMGTALFGTGAWSRVFLPFDAAHPLPLPLVGQALRVMEGGLAQAVLAAGHQNLFTLPLVQAEDATTAGAGESAAFASGEVGVEYYEGLVHKLWSELFGIERIGLDDDFFELGGDSLKVAQLTAELEKYGIKLMPNEVFNHSTIRLLGRYMFANRQSETGRIRSAEGLLEHLRQGLGVAAQWHVGLHEGQPMRTLFVDDELAGGLDALEPLLRELRLPAQLQPHLLAPLSRLPARGADATPQELWQAIGLREDDTALLRQADEAIGRGMQAFNAQVCRGTPAKTYALSPFQRMFLKERNRVTFYMIDFDEPLDRPLLEHALSDVIGVQGLMRSRLRRNRLRQRVWDEFAAPPQPPQIPLVDLSSHTPPAQARAMEKIMEAESAIDFDALAGPMYRVILVRHDRCRHVLFFNLDHSIFDNMSGQVLRRQLLNRYRQLRAGHVAPMASVKSFRNYLDQLNRGPQGITKRKLIALFELERYREVKNAVEERIVARRQPTIAKLHYALDLDRYALSDDDEATWEIALSVLACTLSRFLEQDQVPLKLVYQGRQYQDLSYFDTLGLFIDVLPLLVTVDRDNPSRMIESVRRKVRFVNRYNVNFMNMLLDVKMRMQWWDVLAPMNAGKLGKRDPMILLNYVGKAEAEYQKLIDFSARQMEGAKSTDGYASLYLIVTRVDRSILFDVFCSFENDMGVLQRCFEEETARLLRAVELPARAGPQAPPAPPAGPPSEPAPGVLALDS